MTKTFTYTALMVCLTFNVLQAQQATGNFIRESVINTAGVTSPESVSGLAIGAQNETTTYFDGLGRPIQKVSKQASPERKDVIAPIHYDEYGREDKSYVPYVTSDGDGLFKLDAFASQLNYYSPSNNSLNRVIRDNVPYGKTVFEPSPLNRPLQVFGPGEIWHAGNKAVQYNYLINVDGTGPDQERIVLWQVNAAGSLIRSSSNDGYYPSSQLTIRSTIDEEGNEAREYVDKEGRTVLKKIQYVENAVLYNTEHWAQTYYVYDDFNQLCYVLQPELSRSVSATTPTQTQLDNLAFQYKYDHRKRMVAKKVPGADWVKMIYDDRDRLVLSQDGEQYQDNKWSFTRYDVLNRPVITGVYTHISGIDVETMKGLIAGMSLFESFNASLSPHGYTTDMFSGLAGQFEVMTVTYYDDYQWKSLITVPSSYNLSEFDYKYDRIASQYQFDSNEKYFPRVRNLVTGSKTKVLDQDLYLWNISYYDDKYRVVQSTTSNIKNGYDRQTNLLDFTGKVLTTQTEHFALNKKTTIARRFMYDHMSRLTQTMYRLNDQPEILLSSNEYNDIGQLVTKKLHATADPAIGQQGTTYSPDVIELSQYNGEKVVIARTKIVLKQGFTVPPRAEFTARIGGDWDSENPSPDHDAYSQVIDYRYNIRGWLSRINDSQLNEDNAIDPADYFGMNLLYEQADAGLSNNGLFNGNISAVKWNNFLGQGDVRQKAYTYGYDPLNRLKSSSFKELSTQWNALAHNGFTETDFQYDMNGNIQQLKRNDRRTTNDWMDDLAYTYEGNKLLSVTDGGDDVKGFIDGTNTGNDYTYDNNGNMVRDLNKGIESDIEYNFLNLPQHIIKARNSIHYTYDASGGKLSQTTSYNGQVKRVDYVGGFQYENDVLQSVVHEEGKVMLTGAKLLYEDHGGNLESVTAQNANLSIYPDAEHADYTKITSSGGGTETGILPIGSGIPVQGGQKVKIRVKAFRDKGSAASSSDAWLKLKVNNAPFGQVALLPEGVNNESWIEIIADMPAGDNELTAGVVWTNSNNGEEIYMNEFDITLLEERDPEYQYFLKDHLGNVRLTYTTRNEYDNSFATMEDTEEDRERSEFLRYDLARKIKSQLFDHTNNPADGYAIRLNGSTNERNGLTKTLSVMPGDEIHAVVRAKYIDSNTDNWRSFLTTFVSQLANPPSGMIVDGSGYASSGSTPLGVAPINHQNDPPLDGPMAYLNYIFINKDLDVSSVRTFAKKMTTAGRETGTTANGVDHEELVIDEVIKEPGYVYLYLSNDNYAILGQQIEVYFDDFEVEHSKSKVVQLEDYYAFGLTFNSYQRENSLYNKYQYNGKEIQNELGLGWNDYGARMYMSDIGRWATTDNEADLFVTVSPYIFALNCPISLKDPDGNKVKPANQEAYQLILNTLTAEDAAYVKLKRNGMIDTKLINARNSESGNFKSLKALVNSRERYDFAITEEFETSNGREKFEEWEDRDKSEPDWPVGQQMDAVGYFGQTLFKRGSKEPGPHSKTRHNEIYIFSGLSQEDKLRAISHELFGHASLHEEGKNTAHIVRQEREVPFDNPQAEGKLIQAIELNSELAKKILAAVNEALKNYRESQK